MTTYTNAATKSGTVHAIWWADGVRQGRVCSAAPIKTAATDKPVTCKVCISKVAQIAARRVA